MPGAGTSRAAATAPLGWTGACRVCLCASWTRATCSCLSSKLLRVLIERVLAGNPGPMTLTGTNTYLVGDGAGNLAVIDPGPDDLPEHLEAILSTARRLGRITH